MVKADQHIPSYTFDDYIQWEGRWELIHGHPHAMSPSPKMTHQLLSRNIFRIIDGALLGKATCKCQAVYELDWVIDNSTIVRPDLMIICGTVADDFLRYPPDLIVEIISETTRFKDRHTKFELYEQQGVKYYLLSDSSTRKTEIFELVDNKYKSNDMLKKFILSTFEVEMDFEHLF